jgi:predicted GIY-YIG superfamily endonuclease
VAYYFYVLRSKRDGGLCKAVAQDVRRRRNHRQAGRTRILRHRGPFDLVHVEDYATRAEAPAGERWSKTLNGGKQLRELAADAGSPAWLAQGAAKAGMG